MGQMLVFGSYSSFRAAADTAATEEDVHLDPADVAPIVDMYASRVESLRNKIWQAAKDAGVYTNYSDRITQWQDGADAVAYESGGAIKSFAQREGFYSAAALSYWSAQVMTVFRTGQLLLVQIGDSSWGGQIEGWLNEVPAAVLEVTLKALKLTGKVGVEAATQAGNILKATTDAARKPAEDLGWSIGKILLYIGLPAAAVIYLTGAKLNLGVFSIGGRRSR